MIAGGVVYPYTYHPSDVLKAFEENNKEHVDRRSSFWRISISYES